MGKGVCIYVILIENARRTGEIPSPTLLSRIKRRSRRYFTVPCFFPPFRVRLHCRRGFVKQSPPSVEVIYANLRSVHQPVTESRTNRPIAVLSVRVCVCVCTFFFLRLPSRDSSGKFTSHSEFRSKLLLRDKLQILYY